MSVDLANNAPAAFGRRAAALIGEAFRFRAAPRSPACSPPSVASPLALAARDSCDSWKSNSLSFLSFLNSRQERTRLHQNRRFSAPRSPRFPVVNPTLPTCTRGRDWVLLLKPPGEPGADRGARWGRKPWACLPGFHADSCSAKLQGRRGETIRRVAEKESIRIDTAKLIVEGLGMDWESERDKVFPGRW